MGVGILIGLLLGLGIALGVALYINKDPNPFVEKYEPAPSGPAPAATKRDGATSGTVHIRGMVGERFCVRNSGAEAVVEGIGDHGCEYMTGGTAVVLGRTGRNFGAGMSGGVAYVFDDDGSFPQRVNTEMVSIDELGADDEARLHILVTRHLEETGSAVAERLLADWSTSLSKFVKIMPKDYRRVLDAQQRAAEEGTDPVAAMMEAAHG